MKRINLIGVSAVMAISMPLMLAGCDGIAGFGSSEPPPVYDQGYRHGHRHANADANAAHAHARSHGYRHGNVQAEPAAAQEVTKSHVRKSAATDSGVPASSTPKSTRATAVSTDAPMVPGKAPAVGQ